MPICNSAGMGETFISNELPEMCALSSFPRGRDSTVPCPHCARIYFFTEASAQLGKQPRERQSQEFGEKFYSTCNFCGNTWIPESMTGETVMCKRRATTLLPYGRKKGDSKIRSAGLVHPRRTRKSFSRLRASIACSCEFAPELEEQLFSAALQKNNVFSVD